MLRKLTAACLEIFLMLMIGNKLIPKYNGQKEIFGGFPKIEFGPQFLKKNISQFYSRLSQGHMRLVGILPGRDRYSQRR